MLDATSVLVIIDMLRDFVEPEGSLAVPGAGELTPVIARLASAFRAWGLPVIYLCDRHAPDDQEFADWPPHAVKGSPGSAIVPELAPEPSDMVIPKRRIDTFAEPAFPDALRALGAKSLYVAGVATEYCVLSTALGGRAAGYDVVVVRDAVAGVELAPGDVADALSRMLEAGAELRTADAVLAAGTMEATD